MERWQTPKPKVKEGAQSAAGLPGSSEITVGVAPSTQVPWGLGN